MLLLASLVTGVCGALLAIVLFVVAEYFKISSVTYLEIVSGLILLAVGIISGIFAYRHTARRRALQGLLTSALAILAFSGILFACHVLFEERAGGPSSFYKRLGGGRP